MLIAGNPGHYNKNNADPGAIGSRINEADLTVKYVELINKYLSAVGYKTLFVHHNSLSAICAEANDNDADIFYSIHFNSNAGKPASGTETFYCNGSKNGKILAECIQKQLVDSIGLPDRGLKTDSLYVTRNTNMIACLVEVGFINNPKDESICIDRMDDACRAIARGITDAVAKIYGPAIDQPSTPTKSTPTKVEPKQNRVGMVSKYFNESEVSCHCCGRNGAQQDILDFLDDLREYIGRPLYVTCVYRCPTHNAEVGGVPNSQHVLGYAADTYADGMTVDELADAGIACGADGIGIYYGSDFVHFDVRDGRVGSKIIWYG